MYDDLVGDERHIFRRKASLGKRLRDFRCHEYRDPRCSQRSNQPVERFAEILAEGRGERDLEPRQRVDDHALCIESLHCFENCCQRFVDGKIEGSKIDQLERSVLEHLADVGISRVGAGKVFFRIFFEHRDYSGFSFGQARNHELCGDGRLATAGRPSEHHRVAGNDTAADHVVQSLHAGR